MVLPVEGLNCKSPFQCLASSKILTPHPLTARRVCTPPPLVPGGRTHSIFWKTPDTALYSTYKSTLWSHLSVSRVEITAGKGGVGHGSRQAAEGRRHRPRKRRMGRRRRPRRRRRRFCCRGLLAAEQGGGGAVSTEDGGGWGLEHGPREVDRGGGGQGSLPTQAAPLCKVRACALHLEKNMNNSIKRVIRRAVNCRNEQDSTLLQRKGKYAVANKKESTVPLHKDAFAKDRKEHCFKDMNMRERTLRCRKEQESTLLQRTGNYPVGKEQATYTRNLECDQLLCPQI
jgi:hypothetical protein